LHISINLPNRSDRIRPWGLTEKSTSSRRIFLGGKATAGARVRLTKLPPSVDRLSRQIWDPQHLKTLYDSAGFYGDSFAFIFKEYTVNTLDVNCEYHAEFVETNKNHVKSLAKSMEGCTSGLHSIAGWGLLVIYHIYIKTSRCRQPQNDVCVPVKYMAVCDACGGLKARGLRICNFLVLKKSAFSDVAPCGSSKNQSFGGTYRLHHLGGKNQRTRNVNSN
jgi:hypothetical protein